MKARGNAPAAVFFFVITAVAFLAQGFGGDAGWHLANGLWILKHHLVPLHDFLSRGGYGKAWSDPEWLWDLLLAVSFHLGGLTGILLLGLLVLAAAALALGRLLPPGRLSLVAALLAGLAVLPTVKPRPQLPSLAFFLWEVWAVLAWRRGRRVPVGVLVFLTPLWANMHASAILGPLVLLFAALFEGESDLLPPAGLSLLFLGLRPGGPLPWLRFFWKNAWAENLNLIQEWGSPNFHTLAPMAFLVLLFGAWIRTARSGEARPSHLAALTLLGAGPLLAARFLIYSAPVLALLAVGEEPVSARSARNLGLAAGVAGLLALTSVGLIRGYRMESPAGAVAWLRAHPHPGGVFDFYGYGGLLELFGLRPLVDGRDNLFEDLPWWNSYVLVSRGEEPVSALLRRFPDLTVAVWPRRDSPVSWQLDRSGDWRRVHTGREAAVWFREAPPGRRKPEGSLPPAAR